DLYLYFIEESLFLKFHGGELKYLGSDERSQAILLLKAISLTPSFLEEKESNWRKSTPGIYVKRVSDFFKEFHMLFDDMQKLLILKNIQSEEQIIDLEKEFEIITRISSNILIILPFSKVEDKEMNFMKKLKNTPSVKVLKLPFFSRISDKILYINYQWDLIEEKKCEREEVQ
ncbi:MAG: hypothetical protein ACTSYC_04260, partial [Promethearchaeota archaeon]